MLAVKLHKRKQPWLGKGSFLVPVLDWTTARRLVRRWIKLLNTTNRTRPNNLIRYITLVTIPDDHPVALHRNCSETRECFWMHGKHPADLAIPLRDVDPHIKQKIIRSEFVHRWRSPEVILGAPLPKSCVKWSKDVRLLYQGRRQSRRLERG